MDSQYYDEFIIIMWIDLSRLYDNLTCNMWIHYARDGIWMKICLKSIELDKAMSGNEFVYI